MGRTIGELSEDTLSIQSYLQKQKSGKKLSYANIEHETGVSMDNNGKSKLRTALKRAKIEFSCIPKYGLKLADAGSTMNILSSKTIKIDRAVKRAEKSHKNLQEQFFESLDEIHQKELLYVGAVFGAIRVAADNGKLIYRKKIKKFSNSINIPIPKD